MGQFGSVQVKRNTWKGECVLRKREVSVVDIKEVSVVDIREYLRN